MKPHYKSTFENAMRELFNLYNARKIEYELFTDCLHICCETYRKEKLKCLQEEN